LGFIFSLAFKSYFLGIKLSQQKLSQSQQNHARAMAKLPLL